MITVGLDFGTHQTKVCIEEKDGVELKYTFQTFRDANNSPYYTLPSIIGINKDDTLLYGFLPDDFDGEIIRYFKQNTFYRSSQSYQPNAMYHSIWYIAYILFDLEKNYGQEFAIQMGAPSDSSHLEQAKQVATRIIASAYKLVEEVFENDKDFFLSCTYQDLLDFTEIVEYSQQTKEEYGLLVFPEAYACLKPLISHGKIANGMNLMVDIGGGTTDISFFTIENGMPQVYDFFSINKGLNYLTCADEVENNSHDSNVHQSSAINHDRRNAFKQEIGNICKHLINNLQRELRRQTSFHVSRLMDALKNRPIVYCGGGSTFGLLRIPYSDFRDVKLISDSEWDAKSVTEMEVIRSRKLCPILSTAYGLAISTTNDQIKITPFRDIFANLRGMGEEENKRTTYGASFGSAYGGFSYGDDYDAWK